MHDRPDARVEALVDLDLLTAFLDPVNAQP
jgi:hypothetical protein